MDDGGQTDKYYYYMDRHLCCLLISVFVDSDRVKMISKILLCGIFLVFACNLAEGLNCYLCVGPGNGGCAKADVNQMVKDKCGKAKFLNKLPMLARWEVEQEHHLNPSCVQMTITSGNETIYDRSCAFTPKKMDPCKFIGHFVKVKDCTSCTTDYCNSKVTDF